MCNRVLLLFGKLPQWNLHVNCYVNGTTFQSGLRFQTGLSSLWYHVNVLLLRRNLFSWRHFAISSVFYLIIPLHCDNWELIVSHEDIKGTSLKCSNNQVQILQLTRLILGFGYGFPLELRDNLIMLCLSYASCR